MVSPSLYFQKEIDSKSRIVVEAQRHAGTDRSALVLYGQGPTGLMYSAGSSSPERFAYGDVWIVGDAQSAKESRMHNPREVAVDFRYRSVEAGYHRNFGNLDLLAFSAGSVLKVGGLSLHAREVAIAPAQFSISETDFSLGLTAALDWSVRDSVRAGGFLKAFYDPFGKVRSQQGGISIEYRVSNVGLRYALYRYNQEHGGERSALRFTPSGQQLGIAFHF